MPQKQGVGRGGEGLGQLAGGWIHATWLLMTSCPRVLCLQGRHPTLCVSAARSKGHPGWAPVGLAC